MQENRKARAEVVEESPQQQALIEDLETLGNVENSSIDRAPTADGVEDLVQTVRTPQTEDNSFPAQEAPGPNETIREPPENDEEKSRERTTGSPLGPDDTVTRSTRVYVKKLNRHPIFRCFACMGCGCCARVSKRWPRTFWFFFGVVAPLWILIAISAICGYGLARLEAPHEIVANDLRLQNQYQFKAVANLSKRIIAATPRMCMRFYAVNQTILPEDVFNVADIQDYGEFAAYYEPAIEELLIAEANDSLDESTMWTVNATDMFQFMTKCGQVFESELSSIQSAFNAIPQAGDLTFNWDRCANTSDDGITIIDIPWIGNQSYASFQPEAQKIYYEEVWRADFEKILDDTLNETLLLDATASEQLEARTAAFLIAIGSATGKKACVPNIPASAWFFFTVMTTIGYGNQAPTTRGGQAMVYTLGFLSILAFAATAASSGYIMTSLFDDIMKKANLGILSKPIAATVFWGCLYYSWLILIAGYTEDWKETRLGTSQQFNRGYWFAYISTTTVGLGDIYLEPEVIVAQDLLTFSLLFLIGFVFLASFLGSLGSFIKGVEQAGGKSLPENLEATRICCGHKVVKAGYHLGEEVVKGGYHVGETVARAGHAVVESGQQQLQHRMHPTAAAASEAVTNEESR